MQIHRVRISDEGKTPRCTDHFILAHDITQAMSIATRLFIPRTALVDPMMKIIAVETLGAVYSEDDIPIHDDLNDLSDDHSFIDRMEEDDDYHFNDPPEDDGDECK